MRVSIVIPNWNGKEKLKRNLPSVLEVEGVDEVVVVDDASSDDSVEFLKTNYREKVKIIEKKKNTGFGSNVNLGVKESSGDLVFLLNTDASPSRDCLKTVLPHFEDRLVFSVGCNVGGNWSWAKWEKGFFWHYMVPKRVKAVTHETLWVSGGSGVFRRLIWEELGGFDPLYDPFYVEDVDLGYRARKRGYINIWEADSKVEHHHQGATSSTNKELGVIELNFSKGKISGIAERNSLIFIWKNITSFGLIREHIIALIKRIIRHPRYILVVIRAIVRIQKILDNRRRELREAKLSDEEVLLKFGDSTII